MIKWVNRTILRTGCLIQHCSGCYWACGLSAQRAQLEHGRKRCLGRCQCAELGVLLVTIGLQLAMRLTCHDIYHIYTIFIPYLSPIFDSSKCLIVGGFMKRSLSSPFTGTKSRVFFETTSCDGRWPTWRMPGSPAICRKSRCCFARWPTRESAEFTTHKNLSLLEFSRNPHSINGWYGWFICHGWFPQIFPMNNSISLGDFPAPLDYTRGNHHWSPIIIVNHVSPLIIIYNDHYCRYQRTSSRGHRAWLDSFAASSGPWSRGSEPSMVKQNGDFNGIHLDSPAKLGIQLVLTNQNK